MQSNNAEGIRRCIDEGSCDGLELRRVESSALLSPRTGGVQTAHDERVRPVDGLGGRPNSLEFIEGLRKPLRWKHRHVVVSWDDEESGPERAEVGGNVIVLRGQVPMSQITGDDDEFRIDLFDEIAKALFEGTVGFRTPMRIRDLDEAHRGHGGRDYSVVVMPEEAAEIFDDIYLGLRAGAAERKRRRGEPLSVDEQEALGRWARLSTWRKMVAVGSFAFGTFGLGFTLGGLVFGRWRRPKPQRRWSVRAGT